jgi:hypothetical protein
LKEILGLIMCLYRFDYNIFFALGCLAALEFYKAHIPIYSNYVPRGLMQLVIVVLCFLAVDIIWFLVVMSSWLFAPPVNSVWGKLLVWRWLIVVCALGSMAIKVEA